MSRSKHRNVHVVPAGGRGFVARIARGPLLFAEPTTQGIAIAHAIVEARRGRCEVVIHRADGRIRDKDSYGSDSPRVLDTKH